MAHSYVWHDSLQCAIWLFHVWHDSFICETRRIHMCDMTHSNVWHCSFGTSHPNLFKFDGENDTFQCETWLIHTWDLTHSCVSLGSFGSQPPTTLIVIERRAHSCVRHDLFVHATWLIHMSDMALCNVTHPYEWHGRAHMSDMEEYMRRDSSIWRALFKGPFYSYGVAWVSRID